MKNKNIIIYNYTENRCLRNFVIYEYICYVSVKVKISLKIDKHNNDF